jgi:hypothetical protein
LPSNGKPDTGYVVDILCSTKKVALTEVAYCLNISDYIKFQEPTLSGISVDPTSEVFRQLQDNQLCPS